VTDPIRDAADAALRGEAIVVPTDTVYGIGTRPDDPAATAGIFAAKARPPDLELPVLVPSVPAGEDIASFDERAVRLAARFWAGPLTLVLPRTESSRRWDLGGNAETIGVRMPHHALALAVLAITGPLAVTSANRSGEPTPPTCEGVRAVFGDLVSVYLCEASPLEGRASTVVDLTGSEPRFVRVGALAESDVVRVLSEA
jgi:L-threonylcarbamoyladenylate synthase